MQDHFSAHRRVPNTPLGSCPSRYHLRFPKSIWEILRVPFANDEGGCFMTQELAWQNQTGAPPLQLLVPVPLFQCPLPVPHGTSDQRAGPCFEVKSGVIETHIGSETQFRVVLAHLRRRWGGAWVPSASFTAKACALWSCMSYLSPSISRGLANTWSIGDFDEKNTSGQSRMPRRCSALLLLK